jgi:hypothetical protein
MDIPSVIALTLSLYNTLTMSLYVKQLVELTLSTKSRYRSSILCGLGSH